MILFTNDTNRLSSVRALLQFLEKTLKSDEKFGIVTVYVF